MNKKIFFLILSGIVIFPGLAYAQTLGSMANGLVDSLKLAIDGVIIVMWVVTAFLFLTALGDPAKLKLAKTALFAAIIGTVILILAGSASTFVGGIFHLT